MNKLLTALRAASAALTELDPMGEHHDAALIDDALKLETVDIVVEMDGEGDIYNIVTNTPGVRIAVIDRYSLPESDSDIYLLPVYGEQDENDDHMGYRAAEPDVDPDYVAIVIAAIGENHD